MEQACCRAAFFVSLVLRSRPSQVFHHRDCGAWAEHRMRRPLLKLAMTARVGLLTNDPAILESGGRALTGLDRLASVRYSERKTRNSTLLSDSFARNSRLSPRTIARLFWWNGTHDRREEVVLSGIYRSLFPTARTLNHRDEPRMSEALCKVTYERPRINPVQYIPSKIVFTKIRNDTHRSGIFGRHYGCKDAFHLVQPMFQCLNIALRRATPEAWAYIKFSLNLKLSVAKLRTRESANF